MLRQIEERKIIWSNESLRDYDLQIDYLTRNAGESVAELIANRIEKAVIGLGRKPLGRIGRVEGTFEKSVDKTSLIIAYSLPKNDILLIHRIIHMSRNWPKGNWPS